MEVDQLVQYAPPQGSKTGSTNLPGYTYIDTDFSGHNQNADLWHRRSSEPSCDLNYQYYVTVNLKNVGYDIRYTQIGLTFQRSHKVGPSTILRNHCTGLGARRMAAATRSRAWHPLPIGSQPMQSELGPPMSRTPGTPRRTR